MRWLAEPLWLLGLLLLPLLWWLHRFRSEEQTYPVSALFIMPAIPQLTAGSAKKSIPDRIWWLRAAMILALIVALADPTLFAQRPLTVWVDDSISMYVIEDGETRMTRAMRSLDEQLTNAKYSLLTLRALSAPQNAIAVSPLDEIDRIGFLLRIFPEPGNQPRSEPDTPAAAQIETASRHWVVTDHADQSVNEWLHIFAPDRVIASGSATENVVLSELTLRSSLIDDQRWLAYVNVANLGEQPASGSLFADVDGNPVFDSAVTLQPGASASYNFDVAIAPGATIAARLENGDALQMDNRIVLSAQKIHRVLLADSCGVNIDNALSVHPGIELVANAPDARIVCDSMVADDLPTILVFSGNQPVEDTTAHWMESDPPLNLDISALPGVAAEIVAGDTLMIAGDTVLINRSVGQYPRLNVLFDLNDDSLASQAAYPLLVANLIGSSLDGPLLDPMIRAHHSVDASHIAPRATSYMKKSAGNRILSRVASYSWLLVAAALVLLAIESLLLWRRQHKAVS